MRPAALGLRASQCFTEACLASLTKDYDFALDLGRLSDAPRPPTSRVTEETLREVIELCTKRAGFRPNALMGSACDAPVPASPSHSAAGGRRPPLLPDQFDEALARRTYTNGKEDRPRCARQYREAFAERLCSASVLQYDGLGWGDAEIAQLASVLASGATSKLEHLRLSGNRMGDDGLIALASAMRGGVRKAPGGTDADAAPLTPVLPVLASIDISDNKKIGERGLRAFAEVIGSGALPSLTSVAAFGNSSGDALVLKALRKAKIRRERAAAAARLVGGATRTLASTSSPGGPPPTPPASLKRTNSATIKL